MVGGKLRFNKNGPWPNCISKDKDYCAQFIKSLRDDVVIELTPEGSSEISGFKQDRVRIFYDEETDEVVEPAPHLG